jgi:hypothetical protein
MTEDDDDFQPLNLLQKGGVYTPHTEKQAKELREWLLKQEVVDTSKRILQELRWKILKEEFAWLNHPKRYPLDIQGQTPDEIRAFLSSYEAKLKNSNKPILKKK